MLVYVVHRGRKQEFSTEPARRDSWATLAGFGPAGLSIEPGMVDEILYGLDSAPREHDSLEARDQPPQGGDLG